MGRRGGGGTWGACGGGCAVLAAALVVSALVIRGAGGLKHSHAPAFARKVLLSITSGHQQNNLDNILRPSQWQAPRLQSLGLTAKPSARTSTHVNKQQDRYALSPTIKHEDEAMSPSKQAVLSTMQRSAPPDHFYQSPNIQISPSMQSRGPIVGQAVPPSQMISPSVQTGNPHLQEQVPAASPSLPVQPHVYQPKIAVNTPAAAHFFQQPPWSSHPLPCPPSTGYSAPPSFHTPPTGQDTSRVPVASPPAELPSQRKPPPKAVPPTSITPASGQGKDGISVARPPSNLPKHNSSPPKGTRETDHSVCKKLFVISKRAICLGLGTRETDHSPPANPAIFPPIDSNRDNIPAAPPSMHHTIRIPPQQGQSLHSNGMVCLLLHLQSNPLPLHPLHIIHT